MVGDDIAYKRELLAKLTAMDGPELAQFREKGHKRFLATCQEIMDKLEKLRRLNQQC